MLFVGINPGLRSTALGHHFAGRSNRFWRLLYEAGLVPHEVTFRDDARLPAWGYGLTNMVARASRGSADLGPEDYRAGRRRVIAKIRRHRPRIVVLLGVSVAPALLGPRDAGSMRRPGLKRTTLGGARVFVLPNPSGRNAHYSYAAMLGLFRRLRRLLQAPASGRGRRAV